MSVFRWKTLSRLKNNRRVKTQRKVYPGYVLVHMIETSESWYLVRNTRASPALWARKASPYR